MYAVWKIRKYLQVWRASYFWALQSFQMSTGPLFHNKPHLLNSVIKLSLLSAVLLSGFQSSPVEEELEIHQGSTW